LENVYLKSILLSIKELELEINKENIMIPIINRADIRRLNIDPTYEYYFYGQPDLIRYSTEDIKNAYHKKITFNEFYNKFKNVNNLEYYITIVYEIDGKQNKSNIIYKYNTKNETSLVTFWDIIKTIARQ
jgi:hypothetical protein